MTKDDFDARDEEFGKWLVEGVTKGWISMPICSTHSPVPLRDWEEYELFTGDDDPCIFVMRLWHDGEDEEEDETE